MAKSTFTARQLQAFKQRLVEQLTKLYGAVHGELRYSMVRHAFDDDVPGDEADEALRVQLRDARLSLAENEARRAQEIEAALQRIRDGTFGICIDCGEVIERERLKLLPWAARCIADQTEFEQNTREHAPTL